MVGGEGEELEAVVARLRHYTQTLLSLPLPLLFHVDVQNSSLHLEIRGLGE